MELLSDVFFNNSGVSMFSWNYSVTFSLTIMGFLFFVVVVVAAAVVFCVELPNKVFSDNNVVFIELPNKDFSNNNNVFVELSSKVFSNNFTITMLS